MIGSIKMGMFAYSCVCCVVTLVVSVQLGVAMDIGSFEESEMVLDQKLFIQLLRRVENLEKRDQDQQTEIDSLRGELNTEKAKTARLEGRLSRLQASTGVWQRTGDNTADNLVKTSDDVAISTDDVAATQREPRPSDGREAVGQDQTAVTLDNGQQQQPFRIRRQAETPVIAFHATLSQTEWNTGVHQSIAFDRVVTNIGNAYNPHYGVFMAPLSGVYVFHTTVQVYGGSTTQVSLLKNGNSVAQMYVRGADSVGNSDSAMAVLHMNKGDDVAIQNNYGGVNIEGTHYSHFSGFLLHADEGASIVG